MHPVHASVGQLVFSSLFGWSSGRRKNNEEGKISDLSSMFPIFSHVMRWNINRIWFGWHFPEHSTTYRRHFSSFDESSRLYHHDWSTSYWKYVFMFRCSMVSHDKYRSRSDIMTYRSISEDLEKVLKCDLSAFSSARPKCLWLFLLPSSLFKKDEPNMKRIALVKRKEKLDDHKYSKVYASA